MCEGQTRLAHVRYLSLYAVNEQMRPDRNLSTPVGQQYAERTAKGSVAQKRLELY